MPRIISEEEYNDALDTARDLRAEIADLEAENAFLESKIEDHEEASDPWIFLSKFINTDELLGEVALASRDNHHARLAFDLLRRASNDTVLPLEAYLRLLDARSGGA